MKRKTIPCLDNYIQLSLNNNCLLPIIGNDEYGHWIEKSFSLDFISPRMLFPLAKIGRNITVGDLDILAQRVYKNRADENVTEEQIKEKYQEFIAFLDKLMQDDDEWKKLRGDEFKPAE